MKKIVSCLIVLLIVFGGIYIINDMKSVDEIKTYADRIAHFEEKTIVGEKLVFYNDLNDGSRCYYVIKFTPSGSYIMHCYYYLNNKEQYIDLYTSLNDLVVDYNYQDLMIRTVESSGLGTYNEIYQGYQELFNNGNYIIIS